MDTRHKIVPAEAVAAAGTVVLIVGYFDPLHAVHARQVRDLRTAADTVVVGIDDPADPLLPRLARAELVASLASVNFVVADPEAAMAALPHAQLHDLRAEHAAYRDALASHVIRRQRGE